MNSDYPYIHLDCIDSTNTYLKNHSELWPLQYFTVHAQRQTAGRGRFGRTWHSGKNNLSFSFIFNTENTVKISAITLFAGLALRKALASFTGCEILVKWPNDVYFSGKKLGGILVELIQEQNRLVLVFGIGVNLENKDIPPELYNTMISLSEITVSPVNHKDLINSIMREMQHYLPGYQFPLPDYIIHEFSRYFDYSQNQVSVLENGRIEKKLFNIRGIAKNGNLIVETDNGLETLPNVYELNS